MDYIGEHPLPGQLGHFFIVLSLIASLVAAFAYFKSVSAVVETDKAGWKKLARFAFLTDVISVFAIFGILFYIIHSHYFEYKYAWQHTSLALEVKYMLASFWEGQEGSFLLWTFWHCIIGILLIARGKEWEAPVMTVMSVAQFCLATMIAGIYFFDWKMGSNPFQLLRDSGVLENAPALHLNFDVNQALRPDYMASITDGNDLNPLLQNYWMVIHPPVLFLGFASTIVPFAFVIAGLWTKKFGECTRPALPWALFSAAVLGLGIMMGAAWAYESLTFGGYWAWDPVENASLVPWLVMIAGIHCLLIFRNSGHSLRATYLFLILSFGLVLYSTFLTRTGVLGDTSVHAFTGEGKSLYYHLLIYMGLMLMPAFIFFIGNYRRIPGIKKEESASSREFWMFIGSLVFFLSALVIITKTSLPILNDLVAGLHYIFPGVNIFKKNIAPPEDPEFAYNRIQIFVAIIIGALTAITQYLKYKETSGKFFWKKILIPTIVAGIIASLVIAFGNIRYLHPQGGYGFLAAIWLAIACGIYSIIANAAYIWLGVKGNLKLSGGSIAHLGFGMVLVGILISSSKKEILSFNTSGIMVNFGQGSKENPGENLTLVKGLRTDMGNYWVTYEKDEKHPKKPLWYYFIHFKSKDGKEDFTLRPNAFVNYKGNESLMANPSSRHYWDHDVFTYITALPNPDKNKDTASFKTKTLKPGDSLFYSQGYMILQDIKTRDSLPKEIFGENGRLYEAALKIVSKTGSIFNVKPTLAEVKGELIAVPDTITSESLILQLQNVNQDKTIQLGVRESSSVLEYITLKAYKFPWINILWLGVIITVMGIIISMVRRIQLNNTYTKES